MGFVETEQEIAELQRKHHVKLLSEDIRMQFEYPAHLIGAGALWFRGSISNHRVLPFLFAGLAIEIITDVLILVWTEDRRVLFACMALNSDHGTSLFYIGIIAACAFLTSELTELNLLCV